MKKINLKKQLMLLCLASMMILSSCNKDSNNDDSDNNDNNKYSESGLYLGMMGFNSDLYRYNSNNDRSFDVLKSSTESKFENFVNGLDINISTVLYYAVDNAVSNLENATFPDDLKKVVLITFTDGLDEGSVAYDPKYSDVTSVSKHLKSARVDGKQIEAYTIGLKSNDVVDTVKFKSDLVALASSADNVMEVSGMYELDIKFQDFAASLYKESYTQYILLTVPLKPKQVKTRFTFDGDIDDANQSSCYIEGLWGEDGSLTNITYVGLKCGNGSKVLSSEVAHNKTLRTFTFSDISRADGSDVSKDDVQVWNKNEGSAVWTPNSEFDPEKNTETHVKQETAVIMLVLDCSSSLGKEGFSQIKKVVNNFVDVLWKSSSPNYCRLVFDANGGTGTMSAQMLEKGVSTYLNTNTFIRDNYNFEGWNTKADGSGYSYDKYCTLNANDTLYAQWKKFVGTENGHEWVDLGLSVKWATCNVGASTPEGYGNYYAWGETTTKSTYNSSTYTYSSNPTTLPLNRDAVAVNWGGNWRMPTINELKELKEKCKWTWTGRGYTVTGPNGNSIFLPAAGYRSSSDLYYAGSYGHYWSSSLRTYYSNYAYYLYFDSGNVGWYGNGRYYGQSVRGVFSK